MGGLSVIKAVTLFFAPGLTTGGGLLRLTAVSLNTKVSNSFRFSLGMKAQIRAIVSVLNPKNECLIVFATTSGVLATARAAASATSGSSSSIISQRKGVSTLLLLRTRARTAAARTKGRRSSKRSTETSRCDEKSDDSLVIADSRSALTSLREATMLSIVLIGPGAGALIPARNASKAS